jgi:hypothetical protein
MTTPDCLRLVYLQALRRDTRNTWPEVVKTMDVMVSTDPKIVGGILKTYRQNIVTTSCWAATVIREAVVHLGSVYSYPAHTDGRYTNVIFGRYGTWQSTLDHYKTVLYNSIQQRIHNDDIHSQMITSYDVTIAEFISEKKLIASIVVGKVRVCMEVNLNGVARDRVHVDYLLRLSMHRVLLNHNQGWPGDGTEMLMHISDEAVVEFIRQYPSATSCRQTARRDNFDIPIPSISELLDRRRCLATASPDCNYVIDIVRFEVETKRIHVPLARMNAIAGRGIKATHLVNQVPVLNTETLHFLTLWERVELDTPENFSSEPSSIEVTMHHRREEGDFQCTKDVCELLNMPWTEFLSDTPLHQWVLFPNAFHNYGSMIPLAQQLLNHTYLVNPVGCCLSQSLNRECQQRSFSIQYGSKELLKSILETLKTPPRNGFR